MAKTTYVQDKETGKWVEKHKASQHVGHAVHTFEEFKSPIDGTVISCPRKLAEHNRRHGVTNIQDYGENNGKAYFDQKHKERSAVMTGATAQAKRERRELINQTLRRHGR